MYQNGGRLYLIAKDDRVKSVAVDSVKTHSTYSDINVVILAVKSSYSQTSLQSNLFAW